MVLEKNKSIFTKLQPLNVSVVADFSVLFLNQEVFCFRISITRTGSALPLVS